MVVDTLAIVSKREEVWQKLAFFAFIPFPMIRQIINAGGLDFVYQVPFDTSQKELPSYMQTGEYQIEELFVPMQPVEEYSLN